jgi:DNA polymerase III psi subunit
MSEYKDFEYDFIKRTLEDLQIYNGKYDVTALINSCVGLLVIPKENLFEKIPTNLLEDIKRDFGINKSNVMYIAPERQTLQFDNYDECNIRNIVTHIRNAIAHGRIRQESTCEGQIASLEFRDELRGTKTFEAIMTVDEFRAFAISVADEVLKSRSRR